MKPALSQHEAPIRQFLTGELGKSLLGLLQKTNEAGGHIYAALYELSDPDLIAAIKAFKGRAHLVLSNGSTKTTGQDENSEARAALKAAHVEVEIHDRMVAPGINAHNKFLVLCDAQAKPHSVWTGSTNWTPTGLCTQINNALHILDTPLAHHYLDQWARLRDAGNGFPDTLVTSNDTSSSFDVGQTKATVWFSRTHKEKDMDALREVVANAKEGILFLMFMPGAPGVLASVRQRMAEPNSNLYIQGVVSTLPTASDETRVSIQTISPSQEKVPNLNLQVVQPQGIAHPFAGWAATVTRGDFLSDIGQAIVHSKVLVVDPFTDPVVVTGSHNFSINASQKNDENFVIVRGNALLAQAYAVHVLSVYQHYRWMAYVNSQQTAGKDPWSGLSATPDWQTTYLKGGRRREMEFWVRKAAG